MEARDAEVLVLGAGAAGLAAAAELRERGLDALVLEARPRIGGRVLTEEYRGTPIEIGAEFIHGRPASLLELARAAHCPVKEIRRPHARLRRGEVKSGADDELEAVESLLAAEVTEDTDARSYVQSHAPNERVRELAVTYVEGFYAAPSDLASIEAIGLMGRAAEEVEGSRIYRPTHGYATLLEALASRLRRPVRLGMAVERITWRPGEVEVACHGQPPLRARAAVVTFSCAALAAGIDGERGPRFEPPLVEHAASWRTLLMGNVVKSRLFFREGHWPPGRWPRRAAFVHAPELPVPTWWTLAPISAPILTGWAGGPKANALTAASASEQLELVLASASKVLALSRAELDRALDGCAIADWGRDPWSHGAYCVVPVGGLPAQRLGASPVAGTLFFAGEATQPEAAGTVHGAVDSGRRAAREVFEALKPQGEWDSRVECSVSASFPEASK